MRPCMTGRSWWSLSIICRDGGPDLMVKNLETKGDRGQHLSPFGFCWLLLAASGFPVSVQKPRYLRFSSMNSSWLRFLMTCFQKSCSLRDEDVFKSSFCAEFIAERSTEQVLHNVLNGCCGRRSSENDVLYRILPDGVDERSNQPG